jgi:large subunit ribosomal protein L23
MSRSPYTILVRPIITEQALNGQTQNKYTFEVARDANKKEIRSAIEKAFGVKVTRVNTVNTDGKVIRRFRTPDGKKPDVKKAIITLAEGQALELS